jgi:hypothetical protein
MGTIPYMTVWVMFFCVLLSMMFNPALTLPRQPRQAGDSLQL